ncbi:hypothetical protein ACLB2K_050124 [Fragaria x ananassa]
MTIISNGTELHWIPGTPQREDIGNLGRVWTPSRRWGSRDEESPIYLYSLPEESSYEDDPFVFATSVKQVFYLDDLAKGDAWKVVNLVHPRNIYRAATLGEAEDEEEDVAYQEPNAIGIPNSSTIRLNNFKAGRSVRIRDEEPRLVDVDPNQETDEDSGDEEIHILPEINSDTEEDSSDDSDYEP